MLTAKKRIFCEEYIKCYNATEAYHRAYPNANRKTCGHEGHMMLKKPEVQEYIAELRQMYLDALCVDGNRILEKLAEIAFSDKEDKDYNATAKLKALDLLQKQLNLQNQKVEVKQDSIEVEIK